MLRDPHDAEEAAQEAMARAWRQRHSCRDRQAPTPWLRQIARNEALRLIERRGARPQAELVVEAHEAETGKGPDEAVLDRLEVWQALERLSSQERELLTMRYVLDLKQPDIARQLGIPEATVRVRLHRIRKRLRALMPDVR